jgi:acetylornithine/succinyldiaminopimelate/putrescine aminotransferase
MQPRHPFLDTCDEIIRGELPNLFRLYLNPYVAQTCCCLARYVQTTWPTKADSAKAHQTFLANSFDEALSGAIKLARYAASQPGFWGPARRFEREPGAVLVLDPGGRLGPFCAATFTGARVEFMPGLLVCKDEADFLAAESVEGLFTVAVHVVTGGIHPQWSTATLRRLAARAPLLITCVDRAALADLRHSSSKTILHDHVPDIVVFDESFVNHDVPFGAFTARKELYDYWNRPGKTTFHSTTFQPNTISALHFLRCLEKADPELYAAIAPELQQLESDLKLRREVFGWLYSPSLAKTIRMAGFATANMRARGHFVVADGRQVLDCVGGVACSIRGHNPPTYVEELTAQGERSANGAGLHAELLARLRQLTGLDCLLPAVSGASAVENALKVALVAQHPRRHVLALKSGFGGKTLLALTGTWNAAYKQHLDPLYPDVVYVDPFAPDAISQLEAILERHPVAVVQLELIQAVGGVRKVPEEVVRFLAAGRQRWGYLMLVDEIQTGMNRTGPFTLSQGMGIQPDLTVIGKGTSDMIFPFALLLYSAEVQAKLNQLGSHLAEQLRRRYDYEFGYRTVLNVLQQGEKLGLTKRVAEAGALFKCLLQQEVAGNKAVREVRTYGLLIGIELDADRWPQRWFRKRLYSVYLFSMLRHRRYPVLVGFCQYEPNVLKITPPLTIGAEEVHQVCATIGEVLRRPFVRLLASAVGGLLRK